MDAATSFIMYELFFQGKPVRLRCEPAAVSMMTAAASMGADASTSRVRLGRLSENQGMSTLTGGRLKLKPAAVHSSI